MSRGDTEPDLGLAAADETQVLYRPEEEASPSPS